MTNKTESAIKDKIESASLADLMPDFDREATWDKISVKLQEEPVKKKIAWWYVPSAAAVLLFIVLTYFFFHTGKEIKIQQTVAYHTVEPKTGTPSVVQPLQKADTLKAMVQILNEKEAKQKRLPMAQQPEPLVNNTPSAQSLIPEPIPVTSPDKIIPVATVKPVAVKHFLDIDNEDQSIMKPREQVWIKPSYKERIAQRMIKNQPTDPNALPLRELYYAISN